MHKINLNLICSRVCQILQTPKCVGFKYIKKKQRSEFLFFDHKRSVMGVLAYFQVIKYKMCRCMKKKHKGRNNNDRGAVLSLDDVKRHVSRLLLSTFTVSVCIALTGAHSLPCLHCLNCSQSKGGRDVGVWEE